MSKMGRSFIKFHSENESILENFILDDEILEAGYNTYDQKTKR